MRWCWVNSQCWGILLIWIRVRQGPTALAVGAAGGCLDIFSLVCRISFLSPSLWETARYRLKYCLKAQNNQPILSCYGNRSVTSVFFVAATSTLTLLHSSSSSSSDFLLTCRYRGYIHNSGPSSRQLACCTHGRSHTRSPGVSIMRVDS